MNEYTVFDVETANNNPTSICAIGICVVRDDEIIEQFSSLVKPYPDYYLGINTSIHGLSSADTDDAPTFAQLWPLIKTYFDNKIVLAHNVPFDRRCLEKTLLHYEITIPYVNYGCTCSLSKRYLPELVNHKLNTVAAHYQIKFNHHNAMDDTLTAAQIAINITKQQNKPIQTLLKR